MTQPRDHGFTPRRLRAPRRCGAAALGFVVVALILSGAGRASAGPITPGVPNGPYGSALAAASGSGSDDGLNDAATVQNPATPYDQNYSAADPSRVGGRYLFTALLFSTASIPQGSGAGSSAGSGPSTSASVGNLWSRTELPVAQRVGFLLLEKFTYAPIPYLSGLFRPPRCGRAPRLEARNGPEQPFLSACVHQT
jgi:hypothetical protein